MKSGVLNLVLKRLGIAAITLLIVLFAVFFATSMLPGDTASILLGQAATPEAVAGLREAMHLNDPAILRFLLWLVGLLHGDLGTSYANEMPVAALIGGRLLNTMKLAGITTLLSVPLALTLGITAAMLRGSVYDRTVTILSIGVISAQMIRMTRAAVIETLSTPYVEMALLKGASRSRMVLRHALPNALGPIVNAVALSLSYLVGGVIIVETIFNYPGIAKLMVDAVATRDLPLIQSCAMIFCLGYLFLITAADVVAIMSNPRLR